MTATLPKGRGRPKYVLVKHDRTNNIVRARDSYFLPAMTVAAMVASHSRNVVSTRDRYRPRCL